MVVSVPADAAPSAVLDRVSLVLDVFEGPGRLTLADVVRRTGLPRSSTHRILERLVHLRWLRRLGREYELGSRLVELGSLAVHQDRLHQAAAPILNDLHRATGLAVHLAVLEGSDVLYLDKIGGRFAASLPSRVGGRQPAHCTAVGKAMLAFSTSANAAVRSDSLVRCTSVSIGTTAALDLELAKVRERGIAIDSEENRRNFGCIAAPIGSMGQAVAAVSICGPIADIKFDHRLMSPVRIAALGIWRSMEHASSHHVRRTRDNAGLGMPA